MRYLLKADPSTNVTECGRVIDFRPKSANACASMRLRLLSSSNATQASSSESRKPSARGPRRTQERQHAMRPIGQTPPRRSARGGCQGECQREDARGRSVSARTCKFAKVRSCKSCSKAIDLRCSQSQAWREPTREPSQHPWQKNVVRMMDRLATVTRRRRRKRTQRRRSSRTQTVRKCQAGERERKRWEVGWVWKRLENGGHEWMEDGDGE
jgi:hypothetical protein